MNGPAVFLTAAAATAAIGLRLASPPRDLTRREAPPPAAAPQAAPEPAVAGDPLEEGCG